MPKRIAAQVQWDAGRRVYSVWQDGVPVAPAILVGDAGWEAWLDQTTSFALVGADGAACTVRKEAVQRGGAYWYAYRRVAGRMAKRYLGRATEMTMERLDAVLAALAPPPGPLPISDGEGEIIHQADRRDQRDESRPQPGGVPVPSRADSTPSSPRQFETDTAVSVPPLLLTKMHVPRAGRIIERPHVMQRMQRGLTRPLTLAMAPAGFGKTTALGAWVATLERPVAWVSLDAGDDDPAQFWAYVLAALNGAHPGMVDSALGLLRSPQAIVGAALTRALINAIAAQSADIILILDDFHLITDPAIHAAMGQMLEHPPAQLHLFLATRGAPSLPLARLRAYDRVNEIRADDLRLRPDEVGAFLDEVLDLRLAPDDVITLAERTDGWITGVQLAGLAMQGQTDPARTLAAFRGNHRHVVTYFGEEVLAAQPAEVQAFLLRTAILDRMCGALCDAVTGEHDGQARLAQLHAANIFVVPLDDAGEWYRYDHLFADMLRQRLAEVMPEAITELHLRAAHWLADTGWLVEGVQHWCAAGAYADAAATIQRVAQLMVMRGEVTTLLRLMDTMPEDVRARYPHVRFFEMQARFFRGQLDVVERGIADIERWLAEHEHDAWLAGGVAAINATLCAMRGEAMQVLQHVQRALALLPPEERLMRNGVLVPRGIAEHLLGRMHAADATLREATATSLALGNRTTAVLAMNLRAGGMIRSGRLREAEAICLRIIQLAEETGGVLLSDIYAMLSELHYERNDLVAARLAAEKAIALGEQWVTVDGQIDGALRLAMVLQAQGQPAAAHQMMRRAEDWLQQSLAADSGFPWMPHLVAGMSARLALRQGRLDDVRQWVAAAAQAEDAAPPTLINHYHEFEALAKARLFLLQGDLPQAATLLAQLRPRAEAEERLESLIEIDIVQSLVAQAQGDTDRALDLLAQAVTIGFPAGYVRRFVDEGAPLRALLARLRDGQRRGSALRRACEALLAAFDPAAEAGIPVHAGDQLVEPLSEREREVLRLLAQGRSNQEIARQMVVATSTVKTHLHHIFAKLQTPDRLHAVTRARELGLLG